MNKLVVQDIHVSDASGSPPLDVENGNNALDENWKWEMKNWREMEMEMEIRNGNEKWKWE